MICDFGGMANACVCAMLLIYRYVRVCADSRSCSVITFLQYARPEFWMKKGSKSRAESLKYALLMAARTPKGAGMAGDGR